MKDMIWKRYEVYGKDMKDKERIRRIRKRYEG